MTYVTTIIVCYGGVIASRQLHDALLRHVMRAPVSFYDTTPLGRVLNRFAKDVDVIDVTIPYNVRPFLNNLFSIASSFFVICVVTPWFTLVVAPLMVVYFLAQVRQSRDYMTT